MKNEYKQRRNRLISDLQDAESILAMNLIFIKNDVKQSWKILKTIIGKHTNNLERKMSFSIKDVIVTDNQIIANEFNNFFVSIGPKLAHDLSSDVNPLSYTNNVVNSIVIPTITTLKVRNIISSTKNSSPGWDDIPATIVRNVLNTI